MGEGWESGIFSPTVPFWHKYAVDLPKTASGTKIRRRNAHALCMGRNTPSKCPCALHGTKYAVEMPMRSAWDKIRRRNVHALCMGISTAETTPATPRRGDFPTHPGSLGWTCGSISHRERGEKYGGATSAPSPRSRGGSRCTSGRVCSRGSYHGPNGMRERRIGSHRRCH